MCIRDRVKVAYPVEYFFLPYGEYNADTQPFKMENKAEIRYTLSLIHIYSLEYLEDHYGLVYDHEKYIIRYDAFAVNQLPDVAVLARGTAE